MKSSPPGQLPTSPGTPSTTTVPVTVVISTCGRGDIVCQAIRSLLLNDYPHFEAVVVDQSDDDVTGTCMISLLGDPRVVYLRSNTKGVSIGRNLGIAAARSEMIAITDDDCEVPPNWLKEIASAFEVDSRIGVVFGNVVPGPHDSTSGFVPAYVRGEAFLARSIHDKLQVEGISSCMALRRSVWQALAGFDEMLGVGAPLKSGAESDFIVRVLLAGCYVYETPKVMVTHHGFRTWEQGRDVIRRYWYGTGAMLSKNVRCGHWPVVLLLPRLAWRFAFGRSRVGASLGKHPENLLRLVSFVRGFVAGGMIPVDQPSGHFVFSKKERVDGAENSKETA
jgi:GT2 family glycosyltransferase